MLIFRLYIWKTFIHKLAIITNIINNTKPFRQLIDWSKLLHYSHGSQTCRTSDTAVSSARFLSSRCARAPYQILHAEDMRGHDGDARVCARPNQFINKRRKLKLITASHVRLSLLIFTRSVTRSASFYYHLPHLTPLTPLTRPARTHGGRMRTHSSR